MHTFNQLLDSRKPFLRDDDKDLWDGVTQELMSGEDDVDGL